jgi:hypothetical protein
MAEFEQEKAEHRTTTRSPGAYFPEHHNHPNNDINTKKNSNLQQNGKSKQRYFRFEACTQEIYPSHTCEEHAPKHK